MNDTAPSPAPEPFGAMNREFSIGLTVGTQPPIGRVRGFLRLARMMRAEVAWVVDHFVGFYPDVLWDEDFSWMARPGTTPHAYFDYQTLLGDLAHRARGVRLGVGVSEPIRRHPVLLAQAAVTLAHMTARPPILGLGSGERENVEPFGLPFDRPVGRLAEALEIIQHCLHSTDPIDFAGSHFTLRSAGLHLAPPAGRVPEIWLAAHGSRMLRLTGKYADGWYPTLPMTPAEYEERLGIVRRVAADAGRDPSRIVPAYQAFVVIGRTERDARRLLDARAVRFAALLAPADLWARSGAEHPFGADFRGFVDFVPHGRSRAELDAAIAAVPVDTIAEAAIWGTRQQVATRFGDFRDAGLRHLVVQPASALVSRADAVVSLTAMLRVLRHHRTRT